METDLAAPAQATPKRLNLFEQYLTVWVALCMVVGVLLGKALPGLVATVRGTESVKDRLGVEVLLDELGLFA